MTCLLVAALALPSVVSGQVDTIIGELDEVRVKIRAPDLSSDQWFEGRLVHSREPRCTYVDLRYVTQRDGRNLVDSATGPGDWVSTRLASVLEMQVRAPGDVRWRKVHVAALLRREPGACR